MVAAVQRQTQAQRSHVPALVVVVVVPVVVPAAMVAGVVVIWKWYGPWRVEKRVADVEAQLLFACSASHICGWAGESW